ncbi:variably expressed lipoprotein and hemagglutinin (VlhA) family protein [Mycoplasmoides gallisepticum NC06_2006.080-5-2P]|uniref:FIVAR domain-containing protein n=1 Tax=Mycoplasmoides gallisepticum TaxID=2096 RepID=UPI0002778F31|nr:FIVAR domain-containing protein [Mycoplasmoides gallisepticum]AFP80154.1 variably expressed lipoprotein and hemagglutinin (VlhA) family protein [Mycoplasmoides gallisepticum NC06_2006.080-5-2P]
MKRKNILKFVSLLGIDSFVMLAAASCTSATTPTPNPEPKPTPNPEPKPDPMPNPPSGGMNGGNANPGGGQGMMDSAAQELTAARTALTSLLASKNANVEMYSDYAKIKNDLTAAYTTALTASQNQAGTLEQVKNATSTLQTAIDKAASDKNDFNNQNADLVSAYTSLKDAVKSETTNLEGLSHANYIAIKDNLTTYYGKAKNILTATLYPASGEIPKVDAVKVVNNFITNANSNIEQWKNNANMLSDSFLKKTLDKQQLTSNAKLQQPANYSFVGYSKDITDRKYNFAKRIVWKPQEGRSSTYVPLENQGDLTDVSWIYSLAGNETKYSFTFANYGTTTGYLYFPYKSVKSSDNVALQYKLNDASPVSIDFNNSAISPSQESASDADGSEMATTADDSSPESQVKAERASSTSDASTSAVNSAPSVDKIKVAKIILSELKFGQNTIEFSVPTGQDKVAPMIGNMYISSTDKNDNLVYNDIFSNTLDKQDEPTSVTVNLLKGYSLAADHSTYFYQFSSSNGMNENNPTYLVGFIGGRGNRNNLNSSVTADNKVASPSIQTSNRTLTIYVNAPKDGQYYIKGSYLTSDNRNLKFTTTATANNSITFTVKGKSNWNTLGTFNTADNDDVETSGSSSSDQTNELKTIKLNKGLNKVVITSVMMDNKNPGAPYIGNLTFTLMSPTMMEAKK